MAVKLLLKDRALNPQNIVRLADDLERVYPALDTKGFTETIITTLPRLELKARIALVSRVLKDFLPDDYGDATAILLESLPRHDDRTHTTSDFGTYVYAPYSDFVAQFGCNRRYLTVSLRALKEMTKHYSAEDAIRYFINAYPKESMVELLKWSSDHDYHVRRLASEGTRPILPWSRKIITSPQESIPILDNLFSDPQRFVTRSVANHLNDISKTDPNLMLETLTRWQASGKQTPSEFEFIVRHSLRTLIKRGNPDAFRFLNLSVGPKVTVSELLIRSDPIVIGALLEFEFTLVAQRDERLIVDYVLCYPSKDASQWSRKVFKLKSFAISKGQSLTLTKQHPMHPLATRTLRPGRHRLAIQVNGAQVAEAAFELVEGTTGVASR